MKDVLWAFFALFATMKAENLRNTTQSPFNEMKCYFLTVENGSEFDTLFQQWLENFHFSNFASEKVIEGFISCDSSDDYIIDDYPSI